MYTDDIRYTEPLVKSCIPLPQKLYNISNKPDEPVQEVEKYFPGFKAFIDSTEQEILGT